MTQEEIIRMAREAGLSIRGHYDENGSTPQELERFATLVAAHERNRHAWTQEHWTEYEHAIAAAERKKFMAVCEAEYNKYDALITEEDAGHEEATAIIHLMRKLEGMK